MVCIEISFLDPSSNRILQGKQCDANGNSLSASDGCSLPQVPSTINGPDANLNPWHPFENRAQFQLADFIYCKNKMSAADIDDLMPIWAALHPKEGSPFSSHKDLYEKIDSIQHNDSVPWQSITIKHPNASLPNRHDIPEWQLQDFKVWFRDPKTVIHSILSNPDFKDGIDYVPCIIYNEEHEQVRSNFMSADWAWKQCVSRITC